MNPGARLAARRALTELTTQKIIRATTAERQLEEVLVDFWFNHFNVYAGKGPVRQYVADFERTAKATLTTGHHETTKAVDAIAESVSDEAQFARSEITEAAVHTRTSASRHSLYGRSMSTV